MNAGAYILLFASHATMGIWCIWYWTKPKTYGEAIMVVFLGSTIGFIALILTVIAKVDFRFWHKPLPSAKGQTDDTNKPE